VNRARSPNVRYWQSGRSKCAADDEPDRSEQRVSDQKKQLPKVYFYENTPKHFKYRSKII